MTDAPPSPEADVSRLRPLWMVDGSVPGDIGGRWRSAGGTRASRDGDLVTLALQVGAYRWVEHRLFEVLGAWSAREPEPEPATLFAVLSTQHAGHAERFAERLPVLATIDPATFSMAPAGWRTLLDEMASIPGPWSPAAGSSGSSGGLSQVPQGQAAGGEAMDGLEPGRWPTVARLVSLGRVVLPRLATAYARRLWWCTPSEAPLVPVLRSVLEDTRQAWLTVEAMVQDYLASPPASTSTSSGTHPSAEGAWSVAGYQRRLEELVAPTGGGVPPLRLGPGALGH